MQTNTRLNSERGLVHDTLIIALSQVKNHRGYRMTELLPRSFLMVIVVKHCLKVGVDKNTPDIRRFDEGVGSVAPGVPAGAVAGVVVVGAATGGHVAVAAHRVAGPHVRRAGRHRAEAGRHQHQRQGQQEQDVVRTHVFCAVHVDVLLK